MLDDAELFSELCDKQGLLPEPDIIEAVKLSCSTGELRLSHTSIIAGLCEVMAQVLSSSSSIKLVDLSDCMLLAKGLSYIIKSLCQGSSVTSLYLKGNNIGGTLVEQLGQMLSTNGTLKVMHLEWNNLGSQVDCFAKFCDGLSKNHHIEELDVRYNQISTLCADHLAKALRQNKSLKRLDLAWNSLGMSGGHKILQGVQHNRFLVALNLKGNCVPSEIHTTIKERIAENQKRQLLLCPSGYEARQIHATEHSSASTVDEQLQVEDERQTRSRQKRKKKRQQRERSSSRKRDSPLGDSGNDDDDVDDDDDDDDDDENRGNKGKIKPIDRAKPSASEGVVPEIAEKIQALERILQERAANMDLLQTELVSREEELRTAKAIAEEKTRELEAAKRTHAKAEANWYEERESTTKLRQEAEAKCRAQDKELRRLGAELKSTRDKLEAATQSHEDRVSELNVEVHRLKRELQEREAKHRTENAALRESLKESSGALEKCQDQLQRLRAELREAAEAQARLKMKADEAERFLGRTLKIEDALARSKEERDRLEDKLQESRRTVAQLQKQLIAAQEEALEPQKNCEALKLELHVERERSAALRLDLRDERTRVKEQADQLGEMLARINGLYGQMSEAQAAHAEAARNKDVEMERLRGVVAQKEREVEELRAEQVQRARQFQAAVSKYFGT